MKNPTFWAFALILFTGSAFAGTTGVNAPWKTYTLSGFDNLDHVEIAATTYPTANPAMDNLVFVSGGVTTMGFEGVAPPGGSVGVDPSYTESGYTMLVDGENLIFDAAFDESQFPINSNGTAIFGWCGWCGALVTLSVSRDDKALFSMTSIDLSNLDPESFGEAGEISIVVTGYDSNGAVIATRTVRIIADTAVPVPTLSNWALISLSLLMLLIVFRAGRKVFQPR